MKKIIAFVSIFAVALALFGAMKNPAPKCRVINGELACSMASYHVNPIYVGPVALYRVSPPHVGPVAYTAKPIFVGPVV